MVSDLSIELIDPLIKIVFVIVTLKSRHNQVERFMNEMNTAALVGVVSRCRDFNFNQSSDEKVLVIEQVEVCFSWSRLDL
jgi:hypothetical protein